MTVSRSRWHRSATGETQLTRRSKAMRTLTRSLVLSSVLLLPLPVFAQGNTAAAPTATPAAPAEAAPPPAAPAPAPAPETKKRGGGPSLGLDPSAPQARDG